MAPPLPPGPIGLMDSPLIKIFLNLKSSYKLIGKKLFKCAIFVFLHSRFCFKDMLSFNFTITLWPQKLISGSKSWLNGCLFFHWTKTVYYFVQKKLNYVIFTVVLWDECGKEFQIKKKILCVLQVVCHHLFSKYY